MDGKILHFLHDPEIFKYERLLATVGPSSTGPLLTEFCITDALSLFPQFIFFQSGLFFLACCLVNSLSGGKNKLLSHEPHISISQVT